jgi:hypothetical protein
MILAHIYKEGQIWGGGQISPWGPNGNFLGHRGTPISRSGTSINLSSLIPPIGTRNSHYLARSCILLVSTSYDSNNWNTFEVQQKVAN